MNTIQCEVIIEGVSSHKDKSLGLRISTPELKPEVKTLFFELQGLVLSAVFTPKDEPDVEVYKVDKDINEKSLSERLRGVLYVLYTQEHNEGEDFTDFYRKKMNALIERLKERIHEN